MPPLTDPERLRYYQNALKNWRLSNVVVLEELAIKWLRTNLSPVYARREIAQLLHAHVVAGGEIEEVRETREPWRDFYPFHAAVSTLKLAWTIEIPTIQMTP